MKNRLESILQKIEDIEFFIQQKDENEFELLSKINKNDLKGINAVRNFIAHDYDSVDDEILEVVLRVHISKLKLQIMDLIK